MRHVLLADYLGHCRCLDRLQNAHGFLLHIMVSLTLLQEPLQKVECAKEQLSRLSQFILLKQEQVL